MGMFKQNNIAIEKMNAASSIGLNKSKTHVELLKEAFLALEKYNVSQIYDSRNSNKHYS